MRRFVVLVFAATLISYCGTPPPAGTLQNDAASSDETEEDSKSIEITAAIAGAALVLCYTVPKITPKLRAKNINCRGLIKNGAQNTGQAFKKIGNKITATGRKISEKIKNITKKSKDKVDEAAENIDDTPQSSGN